MNMAMKALLRGPRVRPRVTPWLGPVEPLSQWTSSELERSEMEKPRTGLAADRPVLEHAADSRQGERSPRQPEPAVPYPASAAAEPQAALEREPMEEVPAAAPATAHQVQPQPEPAGSDRKVEPRLQDRAGQVPAMAEDSPAPPLSTPFEAKPVVLPPLREQAKAQFPEEDPTSLCPQPIPKHVGTPPAGEREERTGSEHETEVFLAPRSARRQREPLPEHSVARQSSSNHEPAAETRSVPGGETGRNLGAPARAQLARKQEPTSAAAVRAARAVSLLQPQSAQESEGAEANASHTYVQPPNPAYTPAASATRVVDRPRTATSQPASTSVQVTIGRIEVKALVPPAATRPVPPAPAATGLVDYLKARSRGGGD